MLTRIREVRKAKGFTLADVAAQCTPPTTAQTIGRLETGMRTVSVDWLNRIADALGVDPSELVTLPDRPDVAVAALLTGHGPEAPRRPMVLTPPLVRPDLLGLVVETSQGDYRAGDEVWLERMGPEAFGSALNRDVLAPLPVGKFIFGRLLSVTPETIQILPLGPGEHPRTLPEPVWIAAVQRLVRSL